MNKKLAIGFTIILLLFIGSFVAVNAQLNSGTTTTVDLNSTQPSPDDSSVPSNGSTPSFASHCQLNGREVPCEELAHSVGRFIGWGIGGILFFLLVMLLITIFWIAMLIHAVKYPVEHKAIWILILLLTGILGAIVYYFAVKKQFVVSPVATPPPTTPPPTQ